MYSAQPIYRRLPDPPLFLNRTDTPLDTGPTGRSPFSHAGHMDTHFNRIHRYESDLPLFNTTVQPLHPLADGSDHVIGPSDLKLSVPCSPEAPLLNRNIHCYGFVQSHDDSSLFVHNRGDVFLAILGYVDDIVIATNNEKEATDFKTLLTAIFV